MMDQIEYLSHFSPLEAIGLIVAVVIIISIVWNFSKKVYSELETWRKKKNGVEDEKEEIEKRIEALEANDKRFDDKLDTIAAGVQEVAAGLETFSESVNKRLDSINNEMHERAIIQNRSHLYRLHKQFMDQGEVTLAEREMFDLVSRDYLACGGNSIFKSKIIPEVESLPIKD